MRLRRCQGLRRLIISKIASRTGGPLRRRQPHQGRITLLPAADPSGHRRTDLLEVQRCGTLPDRVIDVTPTLDGVDVAVHRIEVRAHRDDGYVAPPSIAPRRNTARPLVVPATVLL